jgi:N-acetylneuraminate synthase
MSASRARVAIGGRWVAQGEPVVVIAEIGINHNGSLEMARKLIDGAYLAGADAVKFQKRTPELCVPKEQWNLERDTPWGRITYIDYRRRMEFGDAEFAAIDRHCRERGVLWFASCWDEEAVDFMERYDPPCYKVASASLTDDDLLRKVRRTGRPLILSTGMSTPAEIDEAVGLLGRENLLLAHTTSTYPCPPNDLNLRMIETLQGLYPECPVGYSGHETGLAPTWAAVALGASFVERHITLDRALWGSDQAASVEIGGFLRLVSNIRDIEKAMGDGVKRVYEGEKAQIAKLRRVKRQLKVAASS